MQVWYVLCGGGRVRGWGAGGGAPVRDRVMQWRENEAEEQQATLQQLMLTAATGRISNVLLKEKLAFLMCSIKIRA